MDIETKKQCHFIMVFENGEAKSVYADSMSAAIEQEKGWAIIGIWLAEPVDLGPPMTVEQALELQR